MRPGACTARGPRRGVPGASTTERLHGTVARDAEDRGLADPSDEGARAVRDAGKGDDARGIHDARIHDARIQDVTQLPAPWTRAMRQRQRERRQERTPPAPKRMKTMRGLMARAAERPRTRGLQPPEPPLLLTAQVASDPDTDEDVLWHIAEHAPELRRWLIANTAASAELLEYVSQVGGPGVTRGFEVLFESLEE
ncbi:hypothetical protein [Bifidobacterium catulorum]|uniref:variant leucine-rich repeat-containing protein n=1 Tax=Bifidobacterium catulorum TaxID=1630173 RepID=UPI001F4EEBB3|nr:hypothetical protein [Bifidobacterium catulorum]